MVYVSILIKIVAKELLQIAKVEIDKRDTFHLANITSKLFYHHQCAHSYHAI